MNNKAIKYGLLVFLVLLVIPGVLGEFNISEWAYYKDIDSLPESSGVTSAQIDSVVKKFSRPTFTDLRIISGDREVPYIIEETQNDNKTITLIIFERLPQKFYRLYFGNWHANNLSYDFSAPVQTAPPSTLGVIRKTRELAVDIDGDELIDDNCPLSFNPLHKDSDNDGFGDVCDNCPEVFNPSQTDDNFDNIGDACQDEDNDGIMNDVDNCPTIKNPQQEDPDGDSVGSACDNCPNVPNKDQIDLNNNTIGDVCEDSDNDGIINFEDNCLEAPNPRQKDTDKDGVGDACEDSDNDGIINSEDNCRYAENPEQNDTDSDGLGDECDTRNDNLKQSTNIVWVTMIVSIIMIGIILYRMSVPEKKTKETTKEKPKK